jgi:hypothetical protein
MSAAADDVFRVRYPCPTIYPERQTWVAGMAPDAPPLITHDVPCEGFLHPCPVCGARRWCGREARCLDGQAPTHWQRARFAIEDVYDPPVDGWTRGETWNGWACPRFEWAAAQRVMEQTNASRDGDWDPVLGHPPIVYDVEADRFVVRLEPGDDPDYVAGEAMVTAAGGVVMVYAIGAWAWTWEAC